MCVQSRCEQVHTQRRDQTLHTHTPTFFLFHSASPRFLPRGIVERVQVEQSRRHAVLRTASGRHTGPCAWSNAIGRFDHGTMFIPWCALFPQPCSNTKHTYLTHACCSVPISSHTVAHARTQRTHVRRPHSWHAGARGTTLCSNAPLLVRPPAHPPGRASARSRHSSSNDACVCCVAPGALHCARELVWVGLAATGWILVTLAPQTPSVDLPDPLRQSSTTASSSHPRTLHNNG